MALRASGPPRQMLLRGGRIMVKRVIRFAGVGIVLVLALGTVAQSQTQDRRVGELIVLTRPQSADPPEFETRRLVAPDFARLGLKGTVRVTPGEQRSDYGWQSRDQRDRTWGQGVGS